MLFGKMFCESLFLTFIFALYIDNMGLGKPEDIKIYNERIGCGWLKMTVV